MWFVNVYLFVAVAKKKKKKKPRSYIIIHMNSAFKSMLKNVTWKVLSMHDSDCPLSQRS